MMKSTMTATVAVKVRKYVVAKNVVSCILMRSFVLVSEQFAALIVPVYLVYRMLNQKTIAVNAT